jgi:hypothetical protein
MKTDDLLKQATPRPWKFHLGRGANPRFHIQTTAGYQVASTLEISRFKPEATGQESAAELIVRAVNSFEAMREALKGLLREAPEPHKDVRKSFHYLVQIEAAKKALALAEGEESEVAQ